MKRLGFVLAGAAALTLGACNRNNEDTVENAELNQPAAEELNEQANAAAMDAANTEAAALGTQEQQLNTENATTENLDTPTDDDEQNVSGM